MVKVVRADMLAATGLSDLHVEPRTDSAKDQQRADIKYTDRTVPLKHIHYFTDDCVVHPLCPTHLPGELKDTKHTLHKADCKKTQKYVASLAPARLHPAVLLGTRARLCTVLVRLLL